MHLRQPSPPRRPIRPDAPGYLVVSYIAAIIYALLIIAPLYFVFVSSFKDTQEIYRGLLRLPARFDLTNYVKALKEGALLHAMGVSAFVTVSAILVTLVLAFPASYAIARIPTRLAAWTEGFFGVGFLVPALAMLVPIFLTIVNLGLLNNPLALVVVYPATALPFTVFLLASTLRTVPRGLEESAEIDGANRLQMMLWVFVPLAASGLATVTILNFIGFWSEYLFAMVLLNQQSRTVQLAVTLLKSQRAPNFGLVAAGAVISMIPIYIIFILFQERIVTGRLAGAVRE